MFGTFTRTGTINGNTINFTGPFLILDGLGCTVNTNIALLSFFLTPNQNHSKKGI
jgi:hypothetical protein